MLKIENLIKIFFNFFYKKYLFFSSEIILGQKVFFCSKPVIIAVKKTRLEIGDNVLINSCKKRYHLNMHSRCKILLDRTGATIKIGANTRIHGSCIHAYKKIVIGKSCLIAANTQIVDGNGHDLSFDFPEKRIDTTGDAKDIMIGDNVWIGSNCFILPGTTIGSGSVISANSVVRGNIPEMCLAGGNPIQILKSYQD